MANLIPLGLGGQLKLDILIDGQRVGRADPGGFFFVDLPQGMHSVLCVGQTVNINLVAGVITLCFA